MARATAGMPASAARPDQKKAADAAYAIAGRIVAAALVVPQLDGSPLQDVGGDRGRAGLVARALARSAEDVQGGLLSRSTTSCA